MHEHVHEQGNESRGNIKIGRGIPLRSSRLGLVGVADVVEFHRIDKNPWQPFPVEYKRGKPKPDKSDLVQLCAQAICLEEMLSMPVPRGALFYGRTRRRLNVTFDEALRNKTEVAAREAHALIESGVTPPPVYSKRCESCSLIEECMPKKIEKQVSVKHYLKRITEVS
jgi:CRISPR-associated exonuclease Cas4